MRPQGYRGLRCMISPRAHILQLLDEFIDEQGQAQNLHHPQEELGRLATAKPACMSAASQRLGTTNLERTSDCTLAWGMQKLHTLVSPGLMYSRRSTTSRCRLKIRYSWLALPEMSGVDCKSSSAHRQPRADILSRRSHSHTMHRMPPIRPGITRGKHAHLLCGG